MTTTEPIYLLKDIGWHLEIGALQVRAYGKRQGIKPQTRMIDCTNHAYMTHDEVVRSFAGTKHEAAITAWLEKKEALRR